MSLSSTSASVSFANGKPPLAVTSHLHDDEHDKRDAEKGDDVREVTRPEAPQGEGSKAGSDAPGPPPPPDGGTRAWMTVAGA